MIVEILAVCLFAKIKRCRLKYLFRTWTFYPVLLVQLVLVVFQFSIFYKIDFFLKISSICEPAVVLSFMFAIFAYNLFKPAIWGSASILFGTLLNKIVIAENGGKMPVFPSLSYITGYLSPETFNAMDSLHILGGGETRLKFLTDYIDFGYCVLSPGDVFIHLFVCIMLFALIKKVNRQYADIHLEQNGRL